MSRLCREYRDVITGYWPMTDDLSATLLELVAQRLKRNLGYRGHRGPPAAVAAWRQLSGDSIERISDSPYQRPDRHQRFSTSAPKPVRARSTSISSGTATHYRRPCRLLARRRAARRPGEPTVRDVLDHHQSEI